MEKRKGLKITKDEVIAEIKTNSSIKNNNIGITQSVILKDGPKTFIIAKIQQILNAGDQSHHHIEFSLEKYNYSNSKGLYIKDSKEVTRIGIDDNENDQIGILSKFIDNFYKAILIDPSNYSIVKSHQLYEATEPNLNTDDIQFILEDKNLHQNLIEIGGLNLFENLLKHVLSSEDPKKLIERLQQLDLNSIKEINTLTGVAQLRKIINIWSNNIENENEEFWQQLFSDFPWIVSQVFSTSTVILEDKCYVGGNQITNKGSNIADFIYRNKLTNNTIIIEIKTPATKLLGNPYRQTFGASSELSGSINQALKYKYKLEKNINNLIDDLDLDDDTYAYNVKTLLIIGNISNELTSKKHFEAFELYRNNLKDIEIISFDELFQKLLILLDILEKGLTK